MYISATIYKCDDGLCKKNPKNMILFLTCLIISFTGLSSVNLSLWWGIALKSPQTATSTIAFIVALECKRTMKIT